jgi:hypothetical protein
MMQDWSLLRSRLLEIGATSQRTCSTSKITLATEIQSSQTPRIWSSAMNFALDGLEVCSGTSTSAIKSYLGQCRSVRLGRLGTHADYEPPHHCFPFSFEDQSQSTPTCHIPNDAMAMETLLLFSLLGREESLEKVCENALSLYIRFSKAVGCEAMLSTRSEFHLFGLTRFEMTHSFRNLSSCNHMFELIVQNELPMVFSALEMSSCFLSSVRNVKNHFSTI